MTNYELVRNKVIEAVPEIMELKPYCWVQWKDGGKGMITKVEYGGYLSTVNGGALKMNNQNQIDKVLGSKIGIAEVLMAIPKEAYKLKMMLDDNIILSNMTTWKEFVWNLAHDSLEWHRDNLPETVDFLAEILK